MVGGRQKLFITSDCMYKREIMSLLLVTLGLYHEHQRPDRDQYIDVHMDNVQNSKYTRNKYIQVHMDNVKDVAREYFEKIPSSTTDLLGFSYDFYPITHFVAYAFAKDLRCPTITTTVPDVSFGNSSILSYYDILKIQTVYRCKKGGAERSHPVNREYMTQYAYRRILKSSDLA
ncbi:zinc metalloproteinase nas-6-like [Pecten maximus]|uniref:zinc metalloproteinase nas-6-like n=1 Tax=Pecten maximus TaxID=6579 RepID=UPI001457FBAB|nr:zinc metalloproteinase nas-6-like [Pecten maximus]